MVAGLRHREGEPGEEGWVAFRAWFREEAGHGESGEEAQRQEEREEERHWEERHWEEERHQEEEREGGDFVVAGGRASEAGGQEAAFEGNERGCFACERILEELGHRW